MFTTVILAIHILVCVALIMVILLQSGKGADIGAVFGGGSSNTVFGSTGATPFLSKVTIGAAVLFMVTSIILTYFSGKGAPKEYSVVGEYGTEAPATAPVPGQDVQTGREESATPGGATTGQPGAAPMEAAPSAPAPKSEPAPGAGPSPSPPGSQ
jgi:preprotein translocase subunit SecG